MQKYFIPDSLVKDTYLFLKKRSGISPKNLNSTPLQQIIQFLEEILTKGPIKSKDKNKRLAEDKKQQGCPLYLPTSMASVLPAAA